MQDPKGGVSGAHYSWESVVEEWQSQKNRLVYFTQKIIHCTENTLWCNATLPRSWEELVSELNALGRLIDRFQEEAAQCRPR